MPFSIASLPPVAEFEQTESVTSTTAAPAQPPPGTVNTAGTGPRSLSAFQVVGRLGRCVEPRERDRRGAFRPLGEGAASLGRCAAASARSVSSAASAAAFACWAAWYLLNFARPSASICSRVSAEMPRCWMCCPSALRVTCTVWPLCSESHSIMPWVRSHASGMGASVTPCSRLRTCVSENGVSSVPGPKVSDAAPRSRGQMGP